jgi:hypothetical protein
MMILKKIKYWILKNYRKILKMPEYIVVVNETYQIDDDGQEIPETREKAFCVKNEIANEIIKCFKYLNEAKDYCEDLNYPKKKSKPRFQ